MPTTDAETPEAPASNPASELIPQSFMLGGITWAVKLVDEMDVCGRCLRDEATIKINRSYPAQIQAATFFHELLHAIEYARGIPAESHNEVDIDARSAFLHQFVATQWGAA
jgi:hypothetical protein